MLRFPIAFALCLFFALPISAGHAAPITDYDDFQQRLDSLAASRSATRPNEALDVFWSKLQRTGRIPFIDGNRVALLYRGRARSVAFAGDFNGWDPDQGVALQIHGTDLWMLEATFPTDARIDYKIVLDGGRWILDPDNPRIQRSGFGDNSELRMPDYRPSPWCDRRKDVPRGTLTSGYLASETLHYPVNYRVYMPVGYEHLQDLPVLYVTDGHEYSDDRMGSLCATLDNLIEAGRLRPMMAVFIDPRVYGKNRRAEQYILNESFAQFIATELVPRIDAAWKTSAGRRDRGILGTSLGGLNSAFVALRYPGIFRRALIQSPAFQAGDGRIVDLWRQAPRLDLDIFMTWGTLHDFGDATLEFQRVLDQKGYRYHHRLVNEGHSWGNWRNLLPEMLLEMWPVARESFPTETLRVKEVPPTTDPERE